MNINSIYQIINFCYNHQIRNIYLFPHKNPDADALGACCTLSTIFNSLGFYSKTIIKNNYSDCNGLFDIEKTTYLGSESFVGIICDCSSPTYLENNFYKKAKYLIKIDHHEQTIDDLKKYSLLYVDENASSTCEIITFLIKNLHLNLNKEIYNYLYYGILTDTGKFTYAINDDKTFLAISWLILKGAEHIRLNKHYSFKTTTDLKIHTYILNNIQFYKLKKIKGKKVAICIIPYNIIREFKTAQRNFSKAVNLMSDIEDVDMWSIWVQNKNNEYIVSLRSSEMSNINVEKIVRLFDGGGHFHSAGCLIKENEKDKLLNSIISYVED